MPAAALALGFCLSPAAADSAKDVLKTYADIAQAGYEDSLDTAKTLKLAVDALHRRADRGEFAWRPRRLDCRAHALHADRGVSLR